MKTMLNFSLTNHMERRRRAAAVASQRVQLLPRAKSWLARRLAFDREFRIYMRASYFFRQSL